MCPPRPTKISPQWLWYSITTSRTSSASSSSDMAVLSQMSQNMTMMLRFSAASVLLRGLSASAAGCVLPGCSGMNAS